MRGGFSRPYDATKTWLVICGSSTSRSRTRSSEPPSAVSRPTIEDCKSAKDLTD